MTTANRVRCPFLATAFKRYVDHARHLLDGPFTTLIGESYKRAYDSMVMVQQLAELEEIVGVKRYIMYHAYICIRKLVVRRDTVL